MIHFLFFIVVGFIIFFLTRNIVEFLFSFEDYSIQKRRLNQLKREAKKKDKNTYEAIEQYTEPIVKYIFPFLEKYLPSLKTANLEILRKELKMIGWDDTFSPESFIAASIALKIAGVFMFIIGMSLSGTIKFTILMFAAVMFLGLDRMFKNELKSKRDRLFNDFPDFIRITSGYLSADMPIVQAIADAIKYVGKDWKPYLQQFIIDCDNKGINVALNNLRDQVDLFEVKEFVALVRLTIEQGGNVKEGFVSQAEKIAEMQKTLMIKKVGTRKTMSQVIQGPLLLMNIAVLGLPTVNQVLRAL